MAESLIIVKAAYDAEAGVWYVESSDVEGLNLEATSVEALVAKLPAAIGDLLDENGRAPMTGDVAIELIAHASTRLKAAEAA